VVGEASYHGTTGTVVNLVLICRLQGWYYSPVSRNTLRNLRQAIPVYLSCLYFSLFESAFMLCISLCSNLQTVVHNVLVTFDELIITK